MLFSLCFSLPPLLSESCEKQQGEFIPALEKVFIPVFSSSSFFFSFFFAKTNRFFVHVAYLEILFLRNMSQKYFEIQYLLRCF